MDKFLASIPQKRQPPTDTSGSSSEATLPSNSKSKALPPGVVLDKDGKPCRTCTSSAAWMAMMKQSTSKPSPQSSTQQPSRPPTVPPPSTSSPEEPDTSSCPPDVDALGRSTWTLLHSLSATYPAQPSASMRATVASFLDTFSQLYPCWVCAADFRAYLKTHAPRLESQDEFGTWMCEAHNEVNRKLGKDEFDCALWKERWRDGWKDGRCG